MGDWGTRNAKPGGLNWTLDGRRWEVSGKVKKKKKHEGGGKGMSQQKKMWLLGEMSASRCYLMIVAVHNSRRRGIREKN